MQLAVQTEPIYQNIPEVQALQANELPMKLAQVPIKLAQVPMKPASEKRRKLDSKQTMAATPAASVMCADNGAAFAPSRSHTGSIALQAQKNLSGQNKWSEWQDQAIFFRQSCGY